MSAGDTTTSHGTTAGTAAEPATADAIRQMTNEEAMYAAAEVDGVHIVHRRNRFPIPGTKAEKRAERGVAMAFTLAGLAGVAFVVVFIAVPYKWQLPGTTQNFRYYTPLLGGLLGLLLLAMGIGAVLWAKWLMPEEEVVQDRHDEPSEETDVLLTEATLLVGLDDTGLPRRKMLLRSLGFAGGALAAIPLVALVGAMIRKPGKTLDHTLYAKNPLFPNGVPIVYSDGRRVTTGDLDAGGVATVFPGVSGGIQSSASPTLLIRLRPGQVVKARKGQQDYNFGDYVAFSKICTHAGCPASLYEQQTGRLLCPCHQSQFQVLEDAKPVFGPATRSLPKLPLTVEVVDGVQYLVAKADFPEPIGPGFWERS